MPWCEDCERFHNPPALGEKGECPGCGRVISRPPRAPWHFKALLGAAGFYLAWRAVQGVGWVVERLI